jgi:hypothetical protein
MGRQFVSRKFSGLIIIVLTFASQIIGKYLDEDNFYFTAGVYIGYSGGAAVGIGPKFAIGYWTRFDNGCPSIANNITTGFIRHFGTVYPSRELVLEIQTVKLYFGKNGGIIPDNCTGIGAGASLMWYSVENDTEDYLDFYCRPRISLFTGSILFLNASKTFGLPRKMGFNGLHVGGTAILGLPMGTYID